MIILSWKHLGFTWETVQSALREIPLDIYLIDNAATDKKREIFNKLEKENKNFHYRPFIENWGTVCYNKIFKELGKENDFLTSSNDVIFPSGFWEKFQKELNKTTEHVVIAAPFSISYFMEEPIGKKLYNQYEQARSIIVNYPEDESIQIARDFVDKIYEPWNSLDNAAREIEQEVKFLSPPRPQRGDVLYWRTKGLKTFGAFNEQWGPMATEHEVFTRCHICGLETALLPVYIHHSVNISTRYWDKNNRLKPWEFPQCPFPEKRMNGDKSAIFEARREKLREWGSYGIYTYKENNKWFVLDNKQFIPIEESHFFDNWPNEWRLKTLK